MVEMKNPIASNSQNAFSRFPSGLKDDEISLPTYPELVSEVRHLTKKLNDLDSELNIRSLNHTLDLNDRKMEQFLAEQETFLR